MAENFRVIHVAISDLEAKLNEVDERFVPFVWAFDFRGIEPHAVVVCAQPPKGSMLMPAVPIVGQRRQ